MIMSKWENNGETKSSREGKVKIRRKSRVKIPQMVLMIGLLLLCMLMLMPFAWIFSTSLRLPKESFRLPPSFFPTSFHFENYVAVFHAFPFAKVIFNSLKIAVTVVIANLFITTMAGYAFARIPFKGREVVFMIILAGMMIPSQAKLIPTYIVMSKMGLVGTHMSLILPAIISPLNIFFVRQYMLTIPDSYEEAAYIDGAGRFRIYLRIFLPMSKSVIIMTSLLTFLASWNDFLNPLIFLSKYDRMTLPLGLKVLSGAMGTGSVSVILAGVMLSIIIPTILYVFGQKYILQSVVMSGLKS
ncbi:carbohydrate ABC transporter permease [Lachnospiraceae bacterium]|nr:carbohydrate ABC transporter permease [Lachnospiraceae bacterium]